MNLSLDGDKLLGLMGKLSNKSGRCFLGLNLSVGCRLSVGAPLAAVDVVLPVEHLYWNMLAGRMEQEADNRKRTPIIHTRKAN